MSAVKINALVCDREDCTSILMAVDRESNTHPINLDRVVSGRWNTTPSLAEHRTMKICAVEVCDRPSHAHGYCTMHVRRWRKTGNPEGMLKAGPRFQDPTQRFWAKVDTSGECWAWLGSTTYDGYGKFWLDGADIGAHRWAYEQARGPIPHGLQIDHLCRVRHCVNPDHMEVVTVQENLRRRDIARRNR